MRYGISWSKLNGALKRSYGLIQHAIRLICNTDIAMHLDISRLQSECLHKASNTLVNSAPSDQRYSEIVVKRRFVSANAGGLSQVLDGYVIIAALRRNHANQMQSVEVTRINRKY